MVYYLFYCVLAIYIPYHMHEKEAENDAMGPQCGKWE